MSTASPVKATPVIRGDSTNLDLLRAIAVGCVAIAHFLDLSSKAEWHWHLGQMGVLMFFVHTSLVLMLSLERSSASGVAGQRLFTSFYTRRAFRIYPASIVAVLLAYYIGRTQDAFWRPVAWTGKELAANLTLTQNLVYARDILGVLWSLPLELQMYLFLPFIFLLLRRRNSRWAVALWAAAVGVAFLQANVRRLGVLNVLAYAPCFVPGVIAWRMLKHGRARIPAVLWPMSIAAVSLIWFQATREHHMYYRWVFCLVLGLTIPFFREIRNGVVRRAAATVAKYSYGIYLCHTLALSVSFVVFAGSPLRWPLFVAMFVGLPFAFYHLIEHPGIALGQRVVAKVAPAQTSAHLNTAAVAGAV